MTAQSQYPEARRQAFLHNLADEHLAQEDEAKAARREIAEAAKATAKHQRKLQAEAEKHRVARLAAVGLAENAAKSFVTAVERVLVAADSERTALAGLGVPAETLTHASIKRRLSRSLSGELRKLGSPTEPRFGMIRLADNFRAADSWVEAERRATAALAINKETTQ